MLDFLDRHWGEFLLLVALVSGVATVLLLRTWVARASRRMHAEVLAGEIKWGCHAREITPFHTFGFSGELRVGNDDVLRLRVDPSSAKRGAHDEAWPLDSVRVNLGRSRRDISGARRVDLTVQPISFGQARPRKFACLYQVGDPCTLLEHAT